MPTNIQTGSPYIQCEIEGEKMQLLVDTGATVSVLTREKVDTLLRQRNTSTTNYGSTN